MSRAYRYTRWRLKTLSARLARETLQLRKIFHIPCQVHKHAHQFAINVRRETVTSVKKGLQCTLSNFSTKVHNLHIWLHNTLDQKPENSKRSNLNRWISQQTIEPAQTEWATLIVLLQERMQQYAFALRIVNSTPIQNETRIHYHT